MSRRIVAIIQARMGSTRLPGKVLKPIAGKPLLWHTVHRLGKSRLIEEIAIATSLNPRDDAIVEFGRQNDIRVVRGPEDNVLARFARAADLLDADIIVRVSSDAPFIDADFVDHLLDAMIEQGGDYVLLEEGAETAHEGVDPLTRRGLDKLMMDAADDPVAREHVTGYFKLHPDFVPIARAKPYPKLARTPGRLTVDTPDDLDFVEALHARLDAKAGEASLGDLLMLLDRDPKLREINAHVRQKEIAPQGGVALIRCDGGGGYGFGHVKRMISLARALRDREGIGAIFAVNGSEDALGPIHQAGFEAKLVAGPSAPLDSVAQHPDLCILDCRDGPSRDELKRFVQNIPVSAVIDDGSERRLAVDFAYYPPVPQAGDLDWEGSSCTVRIGWEWALLGLAQGTLRPRSLSPRPTLLVSMGGSDPFGFTLRAARALRVLEPMFRARFVIGPGFENKEQTARAIVALKANFETIEGADGLATEYAACDLALVAFGVTAYELAAFGVPALYLCATEDHARSASAFEAAGMGVSLGLAQTVRDDAIAKAVWALLTDSERRRQMRAAGLMTMDGTAAARIAGDLAGALTAKRNLRKAQIGR